MTEQTTTTTPGRRLAVPLADTPLYEALGGLEVSWEDENPQLRCWDCGDDLCDIEAGDEILTLLYVGFEHLPLCPTPKGS